jgi:HNH endonuclease
VDHLVAEKHGGPTSLENLGWACFRCNSHKGPNLAGLDDHTGMMARLFNPRTDERSGHFRWAEAKLAGKTPEGRATIQVLCINRTDSVLLRRSLIAEGIRF